MYKRYANPLELLDMMLMSGRMQHFVNDFVKTSNEETEEEKLWQYWLHKDWEHSWFEFRTSLNDHNSLNAAPTQDEQVDIVKQSMLIMEGFCPFGEGEADGTVQDIRGDCD